MKKYEFLKAVVLGCGFFVLSCAEVWGAAGDLVWKFETGGSVGFVCPAVDDDVLESLLPAAANDLIVGKKRVTIPWTHIGSFAIGMAIGALLQ